MRRRAAKGLSLLANYTWSVVCRTPRASFADVCVIYPAEQQRPGGREGPALGLFGAFGLLLSITGTFGLASYTVSKRLRELSIRVALGAQAQQILSAALGRMLILLASGSVVGLVLGVTASRRPCQRPPRAIGFNQSFEGNTIGSTQNGPLNNKKLRLPVVHLR